MTTTPATLSTTIKAAGPWPVGVRASAAQASCPAGGTGAAEGCWSTSTSRNTTINLLNEVPVANETSIVIAPVDSAPHGRRRISFTGQFAAAPTATILLYGSNTYPTTAGPQNGQLLATWTNTQTNSQVDESGLAFYWAVVSAYSAGGNLILTAHVS